jgi:hypothetical protein
MDQLRKKLNWINTDQKCDLLPILRICSWQPHLSSDFNRRLLGHGHSLVNSPRPKTEHFDEYRL